MNRTLAYKMFAFALLPAVVCSAEGQSDTGVVIRDSSGVTIVESYVGSWGPGEGWSISPEPLVSVGNAEGPEEYSLHRVRAAIRLSDGRIVIMNSGSDELRYYDSGGEHLYSVGREGFGPGEFKNVFDVWLAGDSLVCFDFGQDRTSVFSTEGEYGRTMMLARPPSYGTPELVGVFPDRSMLVMVNILGDRQRSGLTVLRSEATYWRYSPDGEVLDSLGVFFTNDMLSELTSSGPNMAAGVFAFAPFGRRASTVAFGRHIYYASSEAYEITMLDLAGTLERIIRRPISTDPVTSEDIEAFREGFLEGGDSRVEAWARRTVDRLEYPDTKPAYGTVEVDALGNIWVAEYSLGHEDRSGEWTVFDPDGRMLGVVEVSKGGRFFDIGEDYLLGVWRTELGVEQVRMYRIFKQ